MSAAGEEVLGRGRNESPVPPMTSPAKIPALSIPTRHGGRIYYGPFPFATDDAVWQCAGCERWFWSWVAECRHCASATSTTADSEASAPSSCPCGEVSRLREALRGPIREHLVEAGSIIHSNSDHPERIDFSAAFTEIQAAIDACRVALAAGGVDAPPQSNQQEIRGGA